MNRKIYYNILTKKKMVKYTEFFWAWTNKEKIYQGRFNGKIGKQKKTNKQTNLNHNQYSG